MMERTNPPSTLIDWPVTQDACGDARKTTTLGELGCAERGRRADPRPPALRGRANVTVNLLNPGQVYGDRVTQIDFRVAKILQVGRTRSNIGVDVYNVANSSVPLTYNGTYGATWLRPNSFMPARFVKLTEQFSS